MTRDAEHTPSPQSVVVPVDPTDEMLRAGHVAILADDRPLYVDDARAVWIAMVDASKRDKGADPAFNPDAMIAALAAAPAPSSRFISDDYTTPRHEAPAELLSNHQELEAPAEGAGDPCGGCGETDPIKRCVGCGHDFRARSSAPEARSPELSAAIKRLETANRRHRCENGHSTAGEDMRLVLSTIKRLTNGDGQ